MEMKEIKDFPNYYINKNGEVYSSKRKNLIKMKLEYHSTGYVYVNLWNNGKRKHCRVHRLVCEAFIKNPMNKKCVNHIDGNKSNNCVENLEWCSVSENTKHAFDNGLARNDIGYEDSQSNAIKATNLKTSEILFFGSASEAARSLNVSKSTVMRQIKGLTKVDFRSKYKFERDMKCND